MDSDRISKNARLITVEEVTTYRKMIRDTLIDRNICETTDEAMILDICIPGVYTMLDTDEDVSDPNYRLDYMRGYTEGYCDRLLGIPPKYPIE